MAKRIFQKILVMFLVLGFVTLVCLASGLDKERLIDSLFFVSFIVWAWIVLNDPLEKLFWYRYAITKEYCGMMALYVTAIVSFMISYCTSIFMLGVISLIVFGITQIAAFVVHWYFYVKKKEVYIGFEIERAKWFVMLSKLKDMTRPEIEQACYTFLRFYPKRNVLESNLCLAHPVDPTHKNRTVAEMLSENTYDPYGLKARENISKMIDDYCKLHNIKEEK